jgi:hypothetical protein
MKIVLPLGYRAQQAVTPTGSQIANESQSASVAHCVLQMAVPLHPK